MYRVYQPSSEQIKYANHKQTDTFILSNGKTSVQSLLPQPKLRHTRRPNSLNGRRKSPRRALLRHHERPNRTQRHSVRRLRNLHLRIDHNVRRAKPSHADRRSRDQRVRRGHAHVARANLHRRDQHAKAPRPAHFVPAVDDHLGHPDHVLRLVRRVVHRQRDGHVPLAVGTPDDSRLGLAGGHEVHATVASMAGGEGSLGGGGAGSCEPSCAWGPGQSSHHCGIAGD